LFTLQHKFNINLNLILCTVIVSFVTYVNIDVIRDGKRGRRKECDNPGGKITDNSEIHYG